MTDRIFPILCSSASDVLQRLAGMFGKPEYMATPIEMDELLLMIQERLEMRANFENCIEADCAECAEARVSLYSNPLYRPAPLRVVK